MAKGLIIIPAYNEEKTIGDLIKEIKKLSLNLDILIVDDGSDDKTRQVAESEGAVVISHCINLGAGCATQTGFIYAVENKYDFVIQMDADFQHLPSEIHKLIQPILENQADIVIGSRFLKKSYKVSLLKRIGCILFAKLASIFTGQKITDSTSCFRALNKQAILYFSKVDYPQDFQDADVLFLSKLLGLKLKEVDIKMQERREGKSKIFSKKSIFYYLLKMPLSLLLCLLRKNEYRNLNNQS